MKELQTASVEEEVTARLMDLCWNRDSAPTAAAAAGARETREGDQGKRPRKPERQTRKTREGDQEKRTGMVIGNRDQGEKPGRDRPWKETKKTRD